MSATDAGAQCYATLSSVHHKGERVLNRRVVSTLCRKPGMTPARARFAVERFYEIVRQGTPIRSYGGLLYHLATEAEVPAKFYEREQTREMQAAAVKFAEREGVKVMNITDRS